VKSWLENGGREREMGVREKGTHTITQNKHPRTKQRDRERERKRDRERERKRDREGEIEKER
jgi:hypothetical protein